ncbi:MAG: hypothetical protein H7A47_05945 [Verrucomicrobiales bacterium]|nr:hypothetical protein [Verrucomicrobiales bacterium]
MPAERIDAPVYRPDGAPAGEGYTAALFLVSDGGSLQPLFEQTTFHTLPAEARPYVRGRSVPVLDHAFGSDVTVRLRVWETAAGSYEAARVRGESNDVTVRLRGFDAVPLSGLEGFTMQVVPEPSAASLSLLGLSFLWLASARRTGTTRKSRSRGMRSAEECRRARD